MDRNDYTTIENLQQLQEARERLKHTVRLKELELKYDTKACKEALNPATYIDKLFTKLYSMENLVTYFVKGYEFVKDLLGKNQKTIL